MTVSKDAGRAATLSGEGAAEDGVQRVAYLDKTLWDRLAAAGELSELAEFWLELQCSMIDGVRRAVVLLPKGDAEDLVPAAYWPARPGDGPTSLLGTAQRAVGEQRGVVSGHRKDGGHSGQFCCIAYPFVVDGRVCGAIAAEIADRSADELRATMRRLQWGSAWIEAVSRRQRVFAADHAISRTTAALDVIGLLLDEPGYAPAAKALVTELATRFDCDLVALGMRPRGHTKVLALSHSAEFGREMNLVRAVAAAMDEAGDQASMVAYPVSEDSDFRVTLAHEALSRQLDGVSILTIPLLHADRIVGALLFERASGTLFEQEELDTCDAVAAAAGPILEEKRCNDRWIMRKLWDSLATQTRCLFGPHYLGRKLFFATLVLLIAVFATVEDTYRISAPAKIEGQVQRVIVAPFDGYIASQSARAGDNVTAGTVLAALDDRDLRLEHMRWTTTRQQRLTEYEQALAKHDRAGINISRAQIEQAEAHIALLDEQLKRTQLLAPFDGVLVSGDLSQSIGAAVGRGEELFALAPLDQYRVILEVDETQVLDIAPGQQGQLKVASLLDDTLPYIVRKITPITEARDGRNFFRVEAELTGSNERLRPGMQGIAKTAADERLLIRIWTEKFVNWLRLKLWAWLP